MSATIFGSYNRQLLTGLECYRDSKNFLLLSISQPKRKLALYVSGCWKLPLGDLTAEDVAKHPLTEVLAGFTLLRARRSCFLVDILFHSLFIAYFLQIILQNSESEQLENRDWTHSILGRF